MKKNIKRSHKIIHNEIQYRCQKKKYLLFLDNKDKSDTVLETENKGITENDIFVDQKKKTKKYENS